MNEVSLVRVRDALSILTMAMRADGYDLIVESDQGEIIVRIEATPGACAECLVPKSVLEAIISNELEKTLKRPHTVVVVYTDDRTSHA
jgi:Fe-S cluster biogenesis protein NfuA